MSEVDKNTDIHLLLKNHILSGNLKEVDNIIQIIIDFKFDNMTKKQFINFIELVSIYIGQQIRMQYYSIDGIAYICRKLNILKTQVMAKEFVEDNYINILKILKQLKINKNIDLSNQIVEILCLLFMIEEIDEICIDYIDFIIENDLMEKRFNLSDKNRFNYIYILAYYNKDDEFLTKYNLKNLFIDNDECLDLYKEYKNINDINYKDIKSIIDNIENKDINIYRFIKDKLIKKSREKLDEIIKNNFDQINESDDYLVLNNFIEDEIQVANNLRELDDNKMHCILDYAALIKVKAKVPCYRNPSFTILYQYEIQDVLLCKRCNMMYIQKSDLKYIKYKYKSSYGINIYIKTSEVEKKTKNIDVELNRNQIKSKKINNKSMSKIVVNDNDIASNLNEKSHIKQLGYTTKLSKNERWNILRNKAVPKLGIHKVYSHIEFLIRLNKNKGKNFDNALKIWKEDLDMLNKLK